MSPQYYFIFFVLSRLSVLGWDDVNIRQIDLSAKTTRKHVLSVQVAGLHEIVVGRHQSGNRAPRCSTEATPPIAVRPWILVHVSDFFFAQEFCVRKVDANDDYYGQSYASHAARNRQTTL